jgi:hypothetical protein
VVIWGSKKTGNLIQAAPKLGVGGYYLILLRCTKPYWNFSQNSNNLKSKNVSVFNPFSSFWQAFTLLRSTKFIPQSVKEFDELDRDEKDYFFRGSEDDTKVGSNCSFVVCNPQNLKADAETGGKGSRLDFELYP